MAKRVTTLFIRDDAVNLLVVEGKQIRKWASLPLEPGLVKQGLIVDEAQVADRVKELFKLEKASTDSVIVGLSGHNSLYRLITLPELPEAVIAEAIKHEARRVIPMPLDEVYLSYQLLPSPGGERRVFLAAYPRNITDALISTLQRAGIELRIMDLAPLALCRILDEPQGIIVNARLDHLDIMVMVDRLPQLIRRLALPSEAESLSEILPTIIEEMNRTVAFYNSSHQDKPIDSTMPVFVSGDLAEAPESWQSLASQISYPVSPLSSPLESPGGFIPNEFMVNIGLALKELSPEKWGMSLSLVNVNVVPEVYKPKPVRVKQFLVPVGIGTGIILLLFMAFLIWNSMAQIEVLRSQLAPVENRIAQERSETLALQEQINQIETRMGPLAATMSTFGNMLTSLAEGREVVDLDLHKIDELKPSNVDLTEVIHDGYIAIVTGTTSSENYIFRYARDLRSSGRFPIVIILSITEIVEEESPGFTFAFLLK
ncbi:MAG: pilus assembly protein PilM [Chloroflexi bacterium]|nr:pilus assembly protein PilM [Chloroflexota bacterium]